MTIILESLIAKGRRTTRPKEQRYASCGLADLSSHEETHDKIVKNGKIRNDGRAKRLFALAIAKKILLLSQEFELLKLKTH